MRLKIEFNLNIQHIGFPESFEKYHIISGISIDYTIQDLCTATPEILLIWKKNYLMQIAIYNKCKKYIGVKKEKEVSLFTVV